MLCLRRSRLLVSQTGRCYPSPNSEALTLTYSLGRAADDTDVGKLVRTFHKTYKKIDGLVNCAGRSGTLSCQRDAPRAAPR